VNDLRNALARYYLNNFVDGTKQVNIDFVDDAQMSTLYDFA
jgi:phosphatidylinositol 4-phosphatase